MLSAPNILALLVNNATGLYGALFTMNNTNPEAIDYI